MRRIIIAIAATATIACSGCANAQRFSLDLDLRDGLPRDYHREWQRPGWGDPEWGDEAHVVDNVCSGRRAAIVARHVADMEHYRSLPPETLERINDALLRNREHERYACGSRDLNLINDVSHEYESIERHVAHAVGFL